MIEIPPYVSPPHRSPLRTRAFTLLLTIGALLSASVVASGQLQPTIGQAGKDVPWVPTPDELVDKMLKMAAVTPVDVVVDLGSGDGRTVIAAAKLGARAIGIELESNLVELAKAQAEAAGVTDRVTFITEDLFKFDLSPATVITMFLMPDLNAMLQPTLFGLDPGTRIVSNTFDLEDWTADETAILDPCPTWCTALLWIVPAKVEGTWHLPDGTLTLEQHFQMISGTLRTADGTRSIENGRIRGREINFQVGDTNYTGEIDDTTMAGVVEMRNGPANWNATLVR